LTEGLVKVNRYGLSLRKISAKIFFIFSVCCITASAQQFETTSGPLPTYRKPELLFLTAQPYSELYVEIDAVEGAEPSQEIIQALERFLNKYCDKPDGIDLVRNKPIARSEAQGQPEGVLAWRFMDGLPSDADSAKTAYLYVLFFDSRIARNDPSGEGLEPYSSTRYPCAIFIDVAYWQPYFHKFVPRIICHEMGHLIGLVKNAQHGDGAHCRNRDCLMFPTHSEERALAERAYSEEFDLCSDCREDLKHMKQQVCDSKLSFHGPALVRTERFYRVVQLPNIVYWDFAPFKPIDWRHVSRIAYNRWKGQGTANSLQYITYRNCTASEEVGSFRLALQNAFHDPDRKVVSLVQEIAQRFSTAKTAP
jgi:hypothetical protein